ncbi:UNKNOWN [Stylonychia lemnae]|uniref:Uncharacterized protein n=1 Tax=Stylonychia lemnae TaxID=5949 RepID=A0A077ZNQ3_STYLE|nr:UNKNOWN [Stylonychia lemnae]|eukprot:CDW71104.1 UNKNOWN [Stylonychia lemnae]
MLSKLSKKIISQQSHSTYTLNALFNGNSFARQAQISQIMSVCKQNQLLNPQMRLFTTTTDGKESPSHGSQNFGNVENKDYYNNRANTQNRVSFGVTRNFNKNLPLADQIKTVADQIRATPELQLIDFIANLKFISRQVSVQPFNSSAVLLRKLDTRNDLAVVHEVYEKFIDQLLPQHLFEYTNYLNLLRQNHNDGLISIKVKQRLIKRINTLFTEQQYQNEMHELSFDQVSKILSDSIHFGQVGVVANRLEELLEKNSTISNLNSVTRLLDSLFNSEQGIEQLDRLVRKLEGLLRQQENFNMLNISQIVRLTKIFAYSQHVNLNKHRIIEKLIRHIETKMEDLEENDVINIMNAYVYIQGDVARSQILFNKLNSVVSNQAIQNQQDVSASFLMRYLSVFYDLPSGKHLGKNIENNLVQLLEKKLQEDPDLSSQIAMNRLSKILMRHPESQTIQEVVARILAKQAKHCTFDEIRLAFRSLKRYNSEKFEEIEAKVAEELTSYKKPTPSQLGESIYIIDSMKSREKYQEKLQGLLKLFQDNVKFLYRTNAIELIKHHRFLPGTSENANIVATSIYDTLFQSQEQLKMTSITALIDLYIHLEKMSFAGKNAHFKTDHIKQIREIVSDLTSNQLRLYFKKIVSNNEKLNPSQIRQHLEFLNSQKNADKLPSYYFFILSEKVIQSIRNEETYQQVERNNIDFHLSELLNKIKLEEFQLSPAFFDNLRLCKSYMYQVPQFFEKVLRTIYSSDKIINQDQYIQGLSAQNLYFGRFNQNVALKVGEYIETKFNLSQFMTQIENIYIDDLIFASYVRAAQIIQKIQVKRNITNENLITDDKLKAIVSLIEQRLEKQVTQGKAISALFTIASMGDYRSELLSKAFEARIKAIQSDALAAVSFNQAYQVLMTVNTNDDVRSLGQTSLRLLREFPLKFSEKLIKEASSFQLVKILEKYIECDWLLNDSYNSIIKGIGQQFANFTSRELSKIIGYLNQQDIRHDELLNAVFDKVSSQAVGKPDNVSFNSVVIPILKYMTNTDLATGERFEKLVFGDFVKQVLKTDSTFAQKALDERSNHVQVLTSIFESGLDQTHPEIKQLAEKLVELINKEKFFSYNQHFEELGRLYQILNIGKSPLDTVFNPSILPQLEKNFQKELERIQNPSKLFKDSNIIQALKALGYNDLEYRVVVDGYLVPLYSKEHNTVILVQDSQNLCYDRQYPNGIFKIQKRVIESLPSNPKVFSANLFQLNKIETDQKDNHKQGKVQYLLQDQKIPQVGSEIQLVQEGW